MKINKIKNNIKNIIKNITKNKYILFLILILTIIIIIIILMYFFKKYEGFSTKKQIIDDYDFLEPPSKHNFFNDKLISDFINSYNINAKKASTTVQLPVKITKPYQDDDTVKYLQTTVTSHELKHYIKDGNWPYNDYVDNWLNNDKSEINKLQQFFGNKPATIENLKILFPVRTAYFLLILPSESKSLYPYHIYTGIIKPPQSLHYLSEDEYNSLVNSCKSNNNSDDYEKYKYLVKPPEKGYNWSDDTIDKWVPFFISNTNKILSNPDTTVHPGPPFNNDPVYQFIKRFATEDEAKYYIKNGKWDYPTYVIDYMKKNSDKLTNFSSIFNNPNTIDNLIKLWSPLMTYSAIIYPDPDEQNDKTKPSVQYFTGTLPSPQPNNFAHLCNEILDEEYGYNYDYNYNYNS